MSFKKGTATSKMKECPACGKQVRARGYVSHIRMQHGVSNQSSGEEIITPAKSRNGIKWPDYEPTQENDIDWCCDLLDNNTKYVRSDCRKFIDMYFTQQGGCDVLPGIRSYIMKISIISFGKNGIYRLMEAWLDRADGLENNTRL